MIWVCCPRPQKWHTYNPLLCKEFATPLYNLFHEKTLDKSFFVKQLQNTLSPYEMLQGHLLNSHFPNPTLPHPTPLPPKKKGQKYRHSPPIRQKNLRRPSQKNLIHYGREILIELSQSRTKVRGLLVQSRLEWPSTGALRAKRYPHNTVGQYC